MTESKPKPATDNQTASHADAVAKLDSAIRELTQRNKRAVKHREEVGSRIAQQRELLREMKARRAALKRA